MGKRVLIVSARMGAGHDGAAKELAKTLSDRGFEVETRDFLDAAPLAGRFLERTYELQLDHAQWSYEALFRISTTIKSIKPPIVTLFYLIFFPRIRKWIKELDVDIVLATYPFASLVLGRARRSSIRPMKIPAYTFLTDFSVHTMWVDEGIDDYLAVHNVSVRQVERLVNKTPIVTGPAVSDRFREIAELSPNELRREFGIPTDAVSALIVAGSWGAGDLRDTLLSLDGNPDIFPVVVCGKNEALENDLKARGIGLVLGWTDKMPELMRACDVVIQNAGGLTALEAFAANVPVVSYNPLKGHGLRNVVQMEAAGVSLWARNRSELVDTVHELKANPELTSKRAAGIFMDDHGEIIENSLTSNNFRRRYRPEDRKPSGVVFRLASIFIVLIAGANIFANAATTQLNVTSASSSTPYIYALVTMTPQSLNDPRLIRMMATNGIGAVVTGPLAQDFPTRIASLEASGVTIVNGGWPINNGLRIFAPIEAGSKTQKIITLDTGLTRIIYAPVGIVTSVDLAWASLAHDPLVKPVVLENESVFQLTTGRTYEIGADLLTPTQVENRISWLISTLRGHNYSLLPISLVGS